MIVRVGEIFEIKKSEVNWEDKIKKNKFLFVCENIN